MLTSLEPTKKEMVGIVLLCVFLALVIRTILLSAGVLLYELDASYVLLMIILIIDTVIKVKLLKASLYKSLECVEWLSLAGSLFKVSWLYLILFVVGCSVAITPNSASFGAAIGALPLIPSPLGAFIYRTGLKQRICINDDTGNTEGKNT